MATKRRKRYPVKQPGLKWDGTLYEPVTFGEGLKYGSVAWMEKELAKKRAAARSRPAGRTHAERVKRVTAQVEAKRKQPARWYLRSWQFVFYRLLFLWIER